MAVLSIGDCEFLWDSGLGIFFRIFAFLFQCSAMVKEGLESLKSRLKGELRFDKVSRILYSTDASAYRQMPLAVFVPCKDCVEDIRLLLDFCKHNKVSLIPRAGGTSLAGQVVGEGIVVDVSKNLKEIIEINKEERWIRVQPGVVLEELNIFLRPYGLFFAPETSTANRCCIGGMVGNNSCGLHSLVYGSVREHILEAKVILADGEETVLGRCDEKQCREKAEKPTSEGRIYRYILDTYSDCEIKRAVEEAFPDKSLTRRNNGYALDTLTEGFPLNLARLYCGSEGTLAFATEFKLNLLPLPPKEKALVCVHFKSLQDSFYGNLTALRHNPMAVELMDNNIIEAAYRNLEQRENTFFIKGKPKAVLIVEFSAAKREELEQQAEVLVQDFKAEGKAYDFSIVYGEDTRRVWSLRKAGLGLLTNVPGSLKPVSVVEDTAVAVEKLPDYMREFQNMLDAYGLSCVYHAHIATGELHLRPVLNLKEKKDVELFRRLAYDTALLVKKYGGSLSGEHGDGRLRGEWIPLMYGERVYDLMREMKHVWDSDNVFNPGKIVNTPAMNDNLRYEGTKRSEVHTYYDFTKEQGVLCAAEQCNGAAECRKSSIIGGLMCPTFKVSGKEEESTRARANIVREMLSFSKEKDPLGSKEVKQILDDCLMCKACKRECSSNVDISKLKSEALQHYYDKHAYPLSVLLMNSLTRMQRIAAVMPSVYNFFVSNDFTSGLLKSVMGFAEERKLPTIQSCNFDKLIKQEVGLNESLEKSDKSTIYIYIDEFSRFQDTKVAKKAVALFAALGYRVKKAPICESGRIAISKGMLKRAKKIARKNIEALLSVISKDTPLVGLEPSALLSLRDEYPVLAEGYKELAEMNHHVYLFDEFIAKEIDENRIKSSLFTDKEEHIILHGHCQQKALIGTACMEKMLSLPKNYKVEVLPTACCGMAGSYGYEKRHYEMSKRIAESVLVPAIKNASKDTIVAAPGTSCREQIRHFTSREALHPIEILYNALKSNNRNNESPLS